jgi:hypothetical protein
MNRRNILAALAIATLLVANASQVHAQAANNPLISVDERGIGSLQFPGSPAISMPGVLAADPGPGGLPAALTFNLLGPPSLVAGDVLLLESVSGGTSSDIIRFNPAGTAPGYPASLVFYSDTSDATRFLADTGFPAALYTNTVTLVEVGPEGNNGFLAYTPTANQPGFVAGFGVTYNFVSDPLTPEPASLTLTALGALVCLGYATRMRRKRSAP